MKMLNKTICVRLRVSVLLLLLLCLALVVTGSMLYEEYMLYDLYFQCLKLEKIVRVELYTNSAQDGILLSEEEIGMLLPLLNNIRLREEPYADLEVMGKSDVYHIHLKTGKEIVLKIYTGEPLCYILDGLAYPIGNPKASNYTSDYGNLHALANFKECVRNNCD